MFDKYHVIVIGAGSGGLVVAIGAAKAGKSVLLIEKGLYGGDCTNFGCIPSKSLIASAEVAHSITHAKSFGLSQSSATTEGVFERVREIVTSIRSHEEPPVLKEMGVETLNGVASFEDTHRILVKEEDGKTHEVYGKHIVIATGSSPRIPNLDGLEKMPYLTNESIFDLKDVPTSLCILGGGPIGTEMAQAFSRLGSKVTQVHRHTHLLNREEVNSQDVIEKRFAQEGIELFLNFETQSVSYSGSEFTLCIKSDREQKEIHADALLIAIGRLPNTEQLKLEGAGVDFSDKGISVDQYGRSSVKHIWAIGDVVADVMNFTHVAENQARTVLTSLLLPWNKKLSAEAIPKVTFTDPEVASFGLLEKEAKERYGHKVAVYSIPFSENDRAITSGNTEGFVKVITRKWSSQILGATIVGPRAGEMIMELSLAAKEKIPLRKLASLIHPYPIYNLAIRKSADQWLSQTVLPLIKKLFRK